MPPSAESLTGSATGLTSESATDESAAGDRPVIAVIDYGIGNLRSAQKALEHVGAVAHLTADVDVIDSADGVVLPGVGAFGACMQALRRAELDDVALAAAASDRPFLGICVGMQMLFEGSDEAPGVTGLGVLPGRIRWLPDTVKRPQMQWNRLDVTPGLDPDSLAATMLDGLDGAWMYFVHSLAPELTEHTVATAQYGGTMAAAAGRDTIFAAQFHPEKSARSGLALLANFVSAVERSGRSMALASDEATS